MTATLAFLFLTFSGAGVARGADTVVSLNFDNGIASQYAARAILSSDSVHGTFFIPSGLVGSNSYYMTWSQIRGLAADGNEIGGNTVDKVDVTKASDAQHQVCDDRNALVAQGFSVSSFAYPYSAVDSAAEGVVQSCGYAVARRQGGVYDPSQCTKCAAANAIPPADPYRVLGTEYHSQPYTLGDLKGWVTHAQANSGGWVPIVFSDICSCSSASSVSASVLQSFVDWLVAQPGTAVKTMRQVVAPSDVAPPQTTISCDGGDCSNTFRSSATVSLSATDNAGVGSTHYTTDGSVPTLKSPTYSGPFTLTKSTTLSFRSWDVNDNVESTHTQFIHVVSPTVVSLTFDDGIETQYQVRSWLSAHGMHGTFFINSATVGSTPYFMTWSQIHDIAADGNEIGGHTLHHPDLTKLTPAQAQQEICVDRTNLINQAFSPTSFAYPFSATNASVDALVKQCGYVVGRRIGGLNNASDCKSCPFAESSPPGNAFEVRTPGWIAGRAFTLQDLEGWVSQAEDNGGGWVPIVFHDICDACADSSVSASDLQGFLDWLGARAPITVVKTVRQMVPPERPGSPIITASIPASPSSDDAPAITGAATTGAPVQIKLYENANCAGSPVATAPVTQFADAGIRILVRRNAVTSISAVASDGPGADSVCSAPITYRQDATPPQTLILTGPPAITHARQIAFTFSASEAGARFQCSLDGASFAACTGRGATDTTAALTDGRHVFRVRAIDPAGNVDASPATDTFVVDTIAPDTRITDGPHRRARDRTPTFGFVSTESGSTFACSLDRRRWRPCRSPHTLPRLALGKHSLRVRATDRAGNADLTPAIWRFRLVRP